jgi:UDPglucose 6-dehydrogenase
MKVTIVGTGYVGLVMGAVLADTGNTVVCVDNNASKVEMLKNGGIPIFEPGLDEMVKRCSKEGRLVFTTDLREGVNHGLIIMLCLPTPQDEDGAADLSHVLSCSSDIGEYLNEYKVIVSKSTVPVGTVDRIRDVIRQKTSHPFDVVSNPEFLKEGAAVLDSLKPDRIVVGTSSEKAAKIMKDLYAPFVRTGNPIIIMDERSSEMTKYAANGFLATKISYMNDLAILCDKVGADVELVRKGMGSDPRIGPQFLFAGLGYGGSCFPKDVKALIKTSEEHAHPLRILKSVDDVNIRQRRVILEKILRHYNNDIAGRTFAVWGLAFKPMTDDIREAPALDIIKELTVRGAAVRVHDPVAMENVKARFPEGITYAEKAYDAVRDADALVIVTEWNEFRNPDFGKMKDLLRTSVVFDGRNIYDPREMKDLGFIYYGIGRGVNGNGPSGNGVQEKDAAGADVRSSV